MLAIDGEHRTRNKTTLSIDSIQFYTNLKMIRGASVLLCDYGMVLVTESVL